MPQMAAATAAVAFIAVHAERGVVHGHDRVGQRLPEARPAGAAVELRLGVEQRQIATGADELAYPVLVEERRAERLLRPLPAHDVESIVAEDLLPLVVG